MAACFDLVPSASQHCFLKTAVTSGLTCGQAYHLQLHIRHLADALIPRRVTIRAAVEKAIVSANPVILSSLVKSRSGGQAHNVENVTTGAAPGW